MKISFLITHHIGRSYLKKLGMRYFHNSGVINGYLPYNHPIILKPEQPNVYTKNAEKKQIELNVTNEELCTSVEKSIYFSDVFVTPIRKHLLSQSEDLNKCVFFYNEMYPHKGMILNLRQTLYDYLQLVGPVRNSWANILKNDKALFEALKKSIEDIHCRDSILSANAETGDTLPNEEFTISSHNFISVFSLAADIDRISGNNAVSKSKFVSAVDNNLIQFIKGNLKETDLAMLEVLAQYGYYKYEIISVACR